MEVPEKGVDHCIDSCKGQRCTECPGSRCMDDHFREQLKGCPEISAEQGYQVRWIQGGRRPEEVLAHDNKRHDQKEL